MSSRSRLYNRFVALAQPQDASVAQATVVADIVPLDDQLGVTDVLSVPASLADMMFGQGDGDRLATFAIMDAARVTNLPEILETSGLDHCCMFQGTAEDEMGHVAPWLVQLGPDHALTRALFTDGALWDVAPGIFVRSRAMLSDVRQHFRKFTKVRDANGKWYFFRYWEPAFAAGLLQRGDPETVQRFLSIGSIITTAPSAGKVTSFHLLNPVDEPIKQAFILRNQDLAALGDVATWQFAHRLAAWLAADVGGFDSSDDVAAFAYGGIIHARSKVGLRDEKSTAEYVAACWLFGYPAELQYAASSGGLSPQRVAQAYQDALKLQSTAALG